VPKMPFAMALSKNASSPGLSFIICTPSFSSARPLSLFKNGTTFFCSHKYFAKGIPWTSRSMVASNKMAPMTRPPWYCGVVTYRVRMSCTLSIASASLEYSFSVTPYSFRVFKLVLALSSRAEMNPGWLWICTICISLSDKEREA